MPDYITCAERFCRGLCHPSVTLVAEDTCPICLDAYSLDTHKASLGMRSSIAETPCRHVFHYTCLRGWLSSGTPSCPLCRTGFYTLRSTSEQSRGPHSIQESSNPFESIEPPPRSDSTNEPGITVHSNTRPIAWPAEDRILIALGQSHWSQRQRLLFMYGPSARVYDLEREPESEYQHRRASFEAPRGHQNHAMQAFRSWMHTFES
jgi:hypothetical protein